jgi:hypothetical protein
MLLAVVLLAGVFGASAQAATPSELANRATRLGLVPGLAPAFGHTQGSGQFPELGRCIKVAKGQVGSYGSNSCDPGTAGGVHGRYNWLSGASDGGYTQIWGVASAPFWETANGMKMSCSGGIGIGNHIGPWEDRLTITFTGCAVADTSCQSTGLSAGEVHTSELSLTYQEIGPNILNWGTVYEPTSPGPFLTADCGAISLEIKGSMIVQTPNNRMATAWRAVKANEAQGIQRDNTHGHRGFTATVNGHTESSALSGIYRVTNNEPLRVRIDR